MQFKLTAFYAFGFLSQRDGSARAKKWLTAYNSETSYEGYLECTYQMDKSNSTYFHQIIFLNDPNIKTINDNDLYDYKPPYLKLVILQSTYITVMFIKNLKKNMTL